MKRAPRSRQRHDLYAKYHDYDSEISDLLGECGRKALGVVAKEKSQPAAGFPGISECYFSSCGKSERFLCDMAGERPRNEGIFAKQSRGLAENPSEQKFAYQRPCKACFQSLERLQMQQPASSSQGGKSVSNRVLILGIGNVLWADEGFGVRCVEVMAETHALPETVRLLDGGTQGLYLLPFLEDADALLVFDAIDYGLPPATMKVVRDGEVPAFMGAKKMSLHQTGFQDVIATAQLMGYCPARMVLIGCQPVELEDYGGGLRPLVAARIPDALAIAREVLAEWGVPVAEGRSDASLLADPSIRRRAYEEGRPSETEACRTGDARFFPGAG